MKLTSNTAAPLQVTEWAPQGCVCWESARCIAHIDVDCFYAQVEELADPSLRFRLLAVRQKSLVVSCSLRTREAVGNLKGFSVSEALRRCPSLHIANGEDLTKYRRVSDRLLQLLQGQPWHGDRLEVLAGGPQREAPSFTSGEGKLCCCPRYTAAARTSWSAVSAAVAADAAHAGSFPHPVERMGLDDFFVDISSASRTVAEALVSTLHRVCHPMGAARTPEDCSCTLSIALASPQQQPRTSGVLLPAAALRCSSCKCCLLQQTQQQTAQSAAAPASQGWRCCDGCCCSWELLCPAFVYDGKEEAEEKGSSSSRSSISSISSRISAERLLQRPLRLAPLVAALKIDGHQPNMWHSAAAEGSNASISGRFKQEQKQKQRQQQQQQLQQPKQSLGTSPRPQGVDAAASPRASEGSCSRGEQQEQRYREVAGGLAARNASCDPGGCRCGLQRLLLVIAAHLAAAMRGCIFSALGGLTTTGGELERQRRQTQLLYACCQQPTSLYLPALRCFGLGVSGVCNNKTLAKMASKEHKPSQQTLLLAEHRRRFLADRPLRSLPGIGTTCYCCFLRRCTEGQPRTRSHADASR